MHSEKPAEPSPGEAQAAPLFLHSATSLRRDSALFALLQVALFLLILLLRLEPLSSHMLNFDEQTSYLAATGHLSEYLQGYSTDTLPTTQWVQADEWQRYMQVEAGSNAWTVTQDLFTHDIHPPLYFLLLRSWLEILGNSYLGARLLSLLLDLGTFVLVVLLGRFYSESRHAWLAGFIWLLSPISIFGGAMARQYSLLTFLSILFALLLAHFLFVAQPQIRKLATLLLLTITGAAGMLTQFVFLTVLCGAAIAVLVLGSRHNRLQFFAILLAMLLPVILLATTHPEALAVPIFLSRQLTSESFSIQRLFGFARQSLKLFLPLALPLALTGITYYAARVRQRSFLFDWSVRARTAFGYTFVMLLAPHLFYSSLYLLGVFSTHARNDHHLLYLTPFVALFATAWMQLLPRTSLSTMVVRLFILGLLLLAAVETLQVVNERRGLDVTLLKNYEVLVVDNVRRPETFVYMDPASWAFAGSQADLLSKQQRWLPLLLQQGGVYVSLYRRGPFAIGDADGQRKILDAIAAEGSFRLISRGLDRGVMISIYEVGK